MGRTSLDILSIEYEFEIISWRKLCGGIVLVILFLEENSMEIMGRRIFGYSM